MGDVLLALCIPLMVCASGIYAVCESWWRRRRPASPPLSLSPWPSPYTHAAARRAKREMLAAAEEIVEEAYARLAGLYDDACGGAHGCARTDQDRGTGVDEVA
ncbi:hypothetical protein ACWCXB_24100 [Streptomyces sp. NPDC001514]